jgi:hypothetical protein
LCLNGGKSFKSSNTSYIHNMTYIITLLMQAMSEKLRVASFTQDIPF